MNDNVIIAFPRCTLKELLARRDVAFHELATAWSALSLSVHAAPEIMDHAISELERCADEFVSAHQALLPMRRI
jgi:hypothetical protein